MKSYTILVPYHTIHEFILFAENERDAIATAQKSWPDMASRCEWEKAVVCLTETAVPEKGLGHEHDPHA